MNHITLKRVAVVDDDPRVLESLESLLESAGFSVDLFVSAEALLASSQLAMTDVLISDIGMAGISGLELSSILKRRLPTLSVILISGRRQTCASVETARRICHRYFFEKPFDSEELLAAVGELMNEAQLRSCS